MIERIEQLITIKKLTASQFSEEIGVQRSSLSHVLSGRNKPSLDFMLKIKNRYPEINLNWLLLGEGEMIENTVSERTTELKDHGGDQKVLEFGGESTDDLTGRTITEEGHSAREKLIAGGRHKLTANDKPVEQVVVLYRDGSFKAYSQER